MEGGTYWKEGAKSNHYGTHEFENLGGGALDKQTLIVTCKEQV